MTRREIALRRLGNQAIVSSGFNSVAEVVRHLGAMQAQDYLGALWSVGLRWPGSTEAKIEVALAEGTVIRTWPMRGTLHLVAAEDARGMLEHLTPRVIASCATRHRALGLDATVFARAERVLVKALEGGVSLSRDEAMAVLSRAKIDPTGQRGYHILLYLGQNQVLCFGPRRGKQQTLVLLDEWVKATPRVSREEALAGLARRYLASHGPATAEDFAWWAGLRVTEARAVVAGVASAFDRGDFEGRIFWFGQKEVDRGSNARVLLAGFDEFLLGYQDRAVPLDAANIEDVVPGTNGMFLPTMVKGGRVIGTWKRVLRKDAVAVTGASFGSLGAADRRAFEALGRRYGEFLGVEETLAVFC